MPSSDTITAQAQRIERLLTGVLPRHVMKALAQGLYADGQAFKRRMRASMAGKFQTGGKRVANAIGVYTSGRTIETLKLGVFTRWPAAEIYQTGGTITPQRRWLVVPVTPRAYTSGGRVKRSWRNPDGTFKRALFDDLRPVKIRGGWLLVRDRGVSRSGRVGRVSARRGVEAVEPVFMLIKQTSRKAVLRFFEEFVEMAGPRGHRLQTHVNRGIQRAAQES